MANSIRVLIVEDSESDAELLKHHLGKAGLNISSERVENSKSFSTALETQEWDLILSDFNLPGFDAFAALSILNDTGKDIPMIIVSGTINEEKAIELLRMGASDYMMKDHLARLVPAIKRELQEAKTRQHQREAEEDLKKSQAQYKMLFDQSPFGVLVVDSDTTLPVEFNEIAHKQLGYTREEFYNIPISTYEAKQNPDDISSRIENLYKTGNDEFDTIHRTKQGESRNVHVILRLMNQDGRRLQHCIFQDITENKKRESDLRESEAAFGDIFQTVKDGIAYATYTGEILTINKALLDILEIPREEIIGKNILNLAKKLLSGNTLEQVLLILINLLKGQEVAPFEVEYKNKTLEINTLINRQSKHLTGVIRDITGQKLAEKKIQKNEALLSAVVSNISDVIAILDTDGTIKYKSPNIEKSFGWKPEGLIGKSGFITVHPEDLPLIRANFETLLQSENQPLSMEYHYLCKDGSARLVKLTATNLSKDPDINGILLNYHDITERRKMELAMAKIEEKFRKAFMTSPDSININRLQDGLYLEINDGFTAMTGYSNEDVIGKTSMDINIWANPEDRARLVKGLREDGKVVNLEAQFRIKDGTIKTCLMSANIIEINGEPCILNITRDITDRRQIELELSKAEEKFRKAFETSPDCISIVRMRDGRYMDINSGFMDLTGYTREEVIGKTSMEVSIWANSEDRTRMINEMREKGRVVNMEAPFLLKNGVINTCLMSANIMEINGEKCILSITRDISDRKKTDEFIQLQSAALNSVANAVTITDAENNITWANPAFYEMTGYSIEEAVGHQVPELIRSGMHDQAFYDNLLKTINNGLVWQGEITNRRKNGELFQEEMTVTPLIGRDGKITHFISVNQDISEKVLNRDIMNSRIHLLEYAVNHNLDELLKETLKEAENLTGSLMGFYHFLEQDEKTISLQAWSTRTVEQYCSIEANESHYPIEKAGVWVDCVRERRPVIHNDYSALPHRKGMPSGHAAVIRELVVPVFRDNKIVGVLGIGNKAKDYTKQDVEIVARLADLAWDVAEKKISETALLESEQHYREIVTDLDKAQSYAHLGSWTWNIQTNQVTWSDEMFRIFGFDRASFSGKLDDIISQSIHPEDRQKVDESNRSVSQDGKPIPLEYRIIRPDHSVRTVWGEAGEMQNDSSGKAIKLSGIVQDITERKTIEERVEAERELLHLCNQADNIRDLGKSITAYLKDLTRSEAVGMRLHHGDDYPYFETIGFPSEFVEKEKFLCAVNSDGTILRDDAGNPVLECMCGNILQSRINLEKPFFTPNGSFWSNSTTELLATTSEADRQARTRNRCNGEGYESVALIPIRHNSRTFGLFQLNDKRKGHFTPSQIEMLEHLANFVAIALAKIESDDALAESEKRYKDLFEHAALPNLLEDFSGVAKIIAELRRQGVTDMRAHFESHPELVTECALQIKVLDVNQACIDFFKVPSKEDLFTQLPKFFTESSWPIFQEEIIALAEGIEQFECDIAANTSTGEEKQINLRLSVDPEYSKTLSRVMVSFTDVTDRNRTEKALEKRVLALTQPIENGGTIDFEDLFNLEEIQKIQDEFANATGVASLILKPDGKAITRPSNFCRLCNDLIRKTEKGQANCMRSDAHIGGISLKGAIIQPCLSGGLWDAGAAIMVGGQHIASWLVGQVRDETQTEENMRKYAREIGVDETEFIKAFNEVTPMSQERFAQIAEALFTFANQLSTMAYQNAQQARFISDRNRAESALKNTEIHFQSLIENAPDGIALIDQNGRFKYVSPSGRKNFGYEIDEEINISPDDVTHPDDLPAVLEVLNRVIQDPTEKLRLEYRLRHKAGTYLWLESTFTNLFHVPSVQAIVINFRDITARREAELKIQEQLDELRRWHENTLGREMRVIELKGEVNQALHQAGQPPRYASNSLMEQKHE